jgi:hypothetical protein
VTEYTPKSMHRYKVKMTCGHIEERLMRPATAGVAFDEKAEFQVTAPYAKCAACRAAAGET